MTSYTDIDELYRDDSFRDTLATVDKEGKRIWIYPKKQVGKYYNYRKWVAWFLLLVLFALPWIKWNGEPLVLFNILERKFIILGFYFAPQDFYLFGLGMIILIVCIVLFTVVFGRLFCGWVCPQTIFMEMVFRRIEYWIEGDAGAQVKLNKSSWTPEKVVKKLSKHGIFFIIAVIISNTFLAYIIGIKDVLLIIREPVSMHLNGFLAMLAFSFTFYFVFANLREQVCTTICPYGRLQGVMLDKNSLSVYYDFVRGEPRQKIRKAIDKIENSAGDCIDCNLCVKVCPTGIDIRNGIQLECINCTLCMDACDEVMRKVNRSEGLIRMDSYNGIINQSHSYFNSRSIAYSLILFLLLGVEGVLLTTRSQVDALVLKTPGLLFQELEEGSVISNLYNFELINKTAEPKLIHLVPEKTWITIEMVGNAPVIQPHEKASGAFFIKIPKDQLESRKTKIILYLKDGDKTLKKIKTNFLGPVH
ncbi:MAG TPA: cytochrome c oxidase accessory protein CcoG [Saprospiraceae bacterium]|nr:cytochrome c oxidase accessory protein CcoG [Saprospiraceae bacterium]